MPISQKVAYPFNILQVFLKIPEFKNKYLSLNIYSIRMITIVLDKLQQVKLKLHIYFTTS